MHLREGGEGAEALVRLVRDPDRHGARLQVQELVRGQQGLQGARLEAAGRAQAAVREDAALGEHVHARLEAEEARGQVRRGGPAGGLELYAEAAAPQRQEVGAVGPHVVDQQRVRGRRPRQGVARVALGLRVAVGGQLHRGGVPEDQVGPQRRLREERPDHAWREVVQYHRDDASPAGVPVDHVVTGVQRRVVGEVPPVGLALGVAVAGELHRGGVAEDQVGPQGRLRQQRPDHSWREIVQNHRDDAVAPGVAVNGMEPRVALGLGEEAGAADLAGDLRRGLALVPVAGELRAEGAVDVRLRGVLGEVQGVDGVRDLGVDLGLRVGLALVVGLAVELQRVARVLERGHEGPGEVQVAHRLPDQQLPGGVPGPARGVGQTGPRDQPVHLRARVVAREGDADLVEDGRLQPGPGHVGAEVHGGSNRGVHLHRDPGLAGQGRQQGVDLGLAVGVAGEAQGEVVVREAGAQGRLEVPVPDGVGAHEQVPGRLPGPRLGVGEVRACVGGERCQRGVERVDGRLQAGLRGRELRRRREAPRTLQGQDVRVVPVQGWRTSRTASRALRPAVSVWEAASAEATSPAGERGRRPGPFVWATRGSRAVAIFWSTSAGVVRRATLLLRSVVVGRSKRAVAIFWSTSAAVCLAAMSRACWSCVLLRP